MWTLKAVLEAEIVTLLFLTDLVVSYLKMLIKNIIRGVTVPHILGFEVT